MAKIFKTNGKKEKASETKTCLVLYSITTGIWLLNAGMQLFGKIMYGSELGAAFITHISMAVVFGLFAINYMLKYLKEKEEGAVNEYIA